MSKPGSVSGISNGSHKIPVGFSQGNPKVNIQGLAWRSGAWAGMGAGIVFEDYSLNFL